jgi:hypothetical protein
MNYNKCVLCNTTGQPQSLSEDTRVSSCVLCVTLPYEMNIDMVAHYDTDLYENKNVPVTYFVIDL